ncbi:MAG: DUF1573 domain-containing protein [Deltaproteobacteria bacterium]|nr:DUF1573 domain-containing protein [Deltaproteobacteria bacterium]
MANFDPAVPPGGEGKITLKVNTKGYQGNVRKSASVKTNDPKNQTISLVVKATVKVPIHVSSRYVELKGKGDKEVQKTISIAAELNKPLNLTVIEYTLKNKLNYAIETVKKGKEYRIRFTSIPAIKENFRGILKLKTNYSEKPEIRFVIHGRFKPIDIPSRPPSSGIKKEAPVRGANMVKAPIYVSSRYIRLYGMEGARISKTVEIRGERSKSLNLTITEFNLKDKLKYTIETLEKGKKYRIKFSVLPGNNRNFNGILKLKTGYPEMPLITFVIHGRFTKKGNNDR